MNGRGKERLPAIVMGHAMMASEHGEQRRGGAQRTLRRRSGAGIRRESLETRPCGSPIVHHEARGRESRES